MKASGTSPIRNALTVDVEDYFQVQAFASTVSRGDWETLPRRVEANTAKLLDLFARHGVSATFFTLGWVAERHPALVRRIVDEGHELASHGHWHERVDSLDEAAFRADIRRSRAVLEDAGGVPVLGYRAPSFSIGVDTLWAFRVLAEEGYRYSSSIYPIRHDLYGMPDAPRVPFRPLEGIVWELPMTTTRIGSVNLPCSGGGYFRLLPYAAFRMGLARVNAQEGRSGIFYTHPWEFDPDQPRIGGASARSRFRHYVNLSRTEGRLENLLRDFAWDRVDRVFAGTLGSAAPAHAG